ncbi:hypothetical protein [Hyphomonas sp. UBA5107]|nr:hypothetical protein [Hyphomonas sp. UBA5107]|tara:strand:- start:5934 stop:7061 length:1128 start_codon:yes stop_codon:yes gene_type:complete
MRYFFLLITFSLLHAIPQFGAEAQVTQERGTAMVDTRRSKVTEEEKNVAIERAQHAAFETYKAKQTASTQKLMSDHSTVLQNSYPQYITETVVLSDFFDKRAKTYEVTVRIGINSTALNGSLLSMSGLDAADSTSSAEIVSLIIARSRSSVQRFDDRVYKREDVNLTAKGNQKLLESTADEERIRSSEVSTSSQINQSGQYNASVSASTETGGSVTEKADKVEWVVADSTDVDQQLLSVLTSVGLNIVPSEFIDTIDLAAIRADFGDGDSLSSATQQSMAKALKDYDIPYVLIGTLDVDFPLTDPVTGNTKVYVTVNAKLLDLTHRFPRIQSAIGPIQFAGEGPTEPVARTNAIVRSAEQVGTELVSSMAVRGVQ